MPSYAPSRPTPKRLYHRGPRPLALDWTVRATNALALIDALSAATDDAHSLDYLARARARLVLLRSAKTNAAHSAAFRQAIRELAAAFYLVEPKQG